MLPESKSSSHKNPSPEPLSPSSRIASSPRASSSDGDSSCKERGESSTPYYEKNLAQMVTEGKPPSYPTSAFCRFSQLRRAQLKKEHPDLLQRKILEQIKKEWKSLPSKKEYKDQAAADYQYYHKLRDIWENQVKPGRATTDHAQKLPPEEPLSPLTIETRALHCQAEASREEKALGAMPQQTVGSTPGVQCAYPNLNAAKHLVKSPVFQNQASPQKTNRRNLILISDSSTRLSLPLSHPSTKSLEARRLQSPFDAARASFSTFPKNRQNDGYLFENGHSKNNLEFASDAQVLKSFFWPSSLEVEGSLKRRKLSELGAQAKVPSVGLEFALDQ